MKYLVKAENNKKSGVYFIRNIKNRRFYIGSTNNLRNRFWGHRSSLRSNKHANQFLQNDWNKCGPTSFIFEEYEIAKDSNDALTVEQELLDRFFDERKQCYNITSQTEKITGCYDKALQRQRQSEAAKARWVRDRGKILQQRKTKEYRAALSESKSKEYTFVNPSGVITPIKNLKKFCKENGLRTNGFYAILNRKRLVYRGWSLEMPNREKCFLEDIQRRRDSTSVQRSKKYFFHQPE